MTPGDLICRMNDKPFKPFRVHLTDGSQLNFTEPGMVIVGESSAVLPTVWTKDDDGNRIAKHWRTIANDHIVQIGDIDETVEGKRRKRK